MNKYRVWVEDKALLSMVVEAEDEKQARAEAEMIIENGSLDFEQDSLGESIYEVCSIDQVTDNV
jgi:hypothetical protein